MQKIYLSREDRDAYDDEGFRQKLLQPPHSSANHDEVLMPESKKLWLGEACHLALCFVIGSIYTYGPLMTYPLYKEIVKIRQEAEASTNSVTLVLFFGRLLSQPIHAFGLAFCGTSLRRQQVFVVTLFLMCGLGLLCASCDRTGVVGVLLGVSTLNLVSSRVLGGSLFVVPEEGKTQHRIFVYDIACAVGCVWTSFVVCLLKSGQAKRNVFSRFGALITPLVICIVAWLLISPQSFFDSAKMAMANNERSAESRALRRDDLEQGGGARDPPNSIWSNEKVRVIAATNCLVFWSFNYYGYTAFPILIAQAGGPALEMVGLLYSCEGIVYCLVMMLVLPWLRRSFFWLFFGSAGVCVILPPLAVCLLSRVHWSLYIVTLFCMDIAAVIHTTTLGVVLLRCLPWDIIPVFFRQVNAVGGMLCAASMVQLWMQSHYGADCTVLAAHGLPLLFVSFVYQTHWCAVKTIFADLQT